MYEINRIKDYFKAEICDRETMIKILTKFLQHLVIFTRLCLFYLQHVVVFLLLHLLLLLVHLFGTTSASFSSVLSISNGIAKKLLKTITKRTRGSETVLLARHKLNGIENIISKVVTDNEISHEGFTLIMTGKK